jgi:hypothetical protein
MPAIAGNRGGFAGGSAHIDSAGNESSHPRVEKFIEKQSAGPPSEANLAPPGRVPLGVRCFAYDFVRIHRTLPFPLNGGCALSVEAIPDRRTLPGPTFSQDHERNDSDR